MNWKRKRGEGWRGVAHVVSNRKKGNAPDL